MTPFNTMEELLQDLFGYKGKSKKWQRRRSKEVRRILEGMHSHEGRSPGKSKVKGENDGSNS